MEQVITPVFDIVLPTHNRLDLTMGSVRALYQNTTLPFHLIVVDDSTDELTPLYFKLLQEKEVAPLNQVSNITFIHSDMPYKTGNQVFNTGFKYAQTDYVATVMNSMRVEPEWETSAIDTMRNNPEIGIIGLKCLFGGDRNTLNYGRIESAGIKMVKYLPTDVGRDLPSHRLSVIYEADAVQWAFAILRKKAVVGVLDDDLFRGFRGWDDIDNCFVVKSKGWKVFFCGAGVGYHEPRATRGSDTEIAAKENRENGEIFYKRWGLWDLFIKDHPEANADIHAMPIMEVVA